MDMQAQRRLLLAKASALVVVIYAYILVRLRRSQMSRPSITYGPMSERDRERQTNLNKIYNCTDLECIEMLRMRRAPFFLLCAKLREMDLLRDNINSNVEEQVAMFLHVVGHNQRFRVIKHTFRRSIETVSRYVRDVLFAIGELRGEMIRHGSLDTHPTIQNSHSFVGMTEEHRVLWLRTYLAKNYYN